VCGISPGVVLGPHYGRHRATSSVHHVRRCRPRLLPVSRRLLAADVRHLPPGEVIPAGTEVIDGVPTAALTVLAALRGSIEVGVWQMTAGGVRDVEGDEVFLVLDGHATVRFDDGETVELRPGALVRLCAGEQTEWRVHETLRKLYVST